MGSTSVFSRRAFTFLDFMMGGMVALVFFILLLAVILLPSLARARELSKRTVCAANLKGTANGFLTYAVANLDEFPIPAHLEAEQDEIGRVRYAPGKVGVGRGRANDPTAGESTPESTEVSTTRAFWYLVRSGASSPRSFICPSSNDMPNNEDHPQAFWDFRSYSEVSYGYQVPFGKLGRPGSDVHEDMALAADKGPYGAALEAGKPDPGVPTATSMSSPREWRPWNSPNHGSEGQNVIYSDGHVNFVMTPLAGTDKDNIYTRWSRADAGTDENELARVQGTPPTGIETPWSDTDSLIYP